MYDYAVNYSPVYWMKIQGILFRFQESGHGYELELLLGISWCSDYTQLPGVLESQ